MGDDYLDVVKETADDVLERQSVKEFIDACFIKVLLLEGKQPNQTQARATITGEVFELCIQEIFARFYPTIDIRRKVDLPDAYMTGSAGADFVIFSETDDVKAIIETKGSADKLEWPDGTIQEPTRPGLIRSDSMKKAVCQAYQADKAYPDIPFYIITSHKPNSGTAKHVADLAEGDIIETIISIQNISALDAEMQQFL